MSTKFMTYDDIIPDIQKIRNQKTEYDLHSIEERELFLQKLQNKIISTSANYINKNYHKGKTTINFWNKNIDGDFLTSECLVEYKDIGKVWEECVNILKNKGYSVCLRTHSYSMELLRPAYYLDIYW